MNKTYMLDTCICSFIMREQPEAVLKRLEQAVLRGQRIVVSAITYSEMRFGATARIFPAPRRAGRRVSRPPRYPALWDRGCAVDATTD